VRTHRAALTAGQITDFASAPTTSAHGVAVDQHAELVYWHLTGATAGTYYYYDGTAWRAGATFSAATDGLVLAQAATGDRVALHVTGGTLTSGTYELHHSGGR
jgi:uncharacterized protein involved in outer membrane biogenesis